MPRASLALSLLVAALAGDACATGPRIDFNEEVRPILVAHCLACHGGVKQAGGLSFVSRDEAMAEGDSGIRVIEPGDHESSYLYDRVADRDDDFRMPPPEHGPRLNEQELATIREWIDQGARWDDPWAFRAPKRPTQPEVERRDWPRRSLDGFVLAKMEAAGVQPSREADRQQWLRRVSFDLTGLPPTESERHAFAAETGANAHGRVVDRLLASPHFGERWASVWLDLARYADTMGFEKDPARDIWPWRDWVVDAFNADLPYDEFLLKQTAGDLLPNATLDDRLATAFHRNTQTNTEGGADDEEYRWSAVVDRVDSTWAGVLGMTMGCARCHSHPYDPISQQDYYAFAAFFNTTQDTDLREDWPELPVPIDRDRRDEMDRLLSELGDVRAAIHEVGLAAAGSRDRWDVLPIDAASSTGETRLVIKDAAGGSEVVAAGTVTDRSSYTLIADAPELSITALRIDAGPRDADAARAIPEIGFVLSRLRAFVERDDASSTGKLEQVSANPASEELFFTEVLADETDGFFRPIDSILDNSSGWGAYTRIRKPRWAVFVLDEPIQLRLGDRLRLEIKHDMATDGQGPLVMQRFTVSTSDADELTRLASDKRLRALREREEELILAIDDIPATATPILVEQQPSLRRSTHLFERGNWLSPAGVVEPATPKALPGGAADRLTLGHWLGARENPLTARVMVNRVWAALFGAGLVETVEDFGSTGAEPSHPRLLDHLTVRFRDDFQWSVKRLLRELVLSATYRQDARATADEVAADPTNRLLARGPRGRLSAEMVRDQALLLSGRFNPRRGGPPVMPYQPKGVWQSVYNNRRWETAEGEDRFRRAIYTYWKRTAAYPSMIAFDAPSREQCTVRRATTNTPLQALVTLNDPAFMELAEGLAERMLARDAESVRERIAWATEEATGERFADAAIDELASLHAEALGGTEADARFAATIVANVILNLDATLTK